MHSWQCKINQGAPQNNSYDSFIGGKPKIPASMEIPCCTLCKERLTFMFQIAFPKGHFWYGKSLALFFCKSHYHQGYPIPEMPNVEDLFGANISEEFLKTYERNFRILIFESELGCIRNDYEEKVTFSPLEICKVDQMDPSADIMLGGTPIWIMDIDETPGKIASSEEIGLLFQIREDFTFDKLPDAPPEETILGTKRTENIYTLFAADRVYFWGTIGQIPPAVYVSVQRP